MLVFVGGVGELYQGDLDLGRRAAELLAAEALGPHVLVEELHYGAVAVAQRLEEVRPGLLILVGAAARGRPPGSVERRRIHNQFRPAADLQAAVREAVTGYVSVDLVVDVAEAFDALPDRTVVVEAEPGSTDPAVVLSPAADAALEEALELVRAEVRRSSLLGLAAELRPLVARLDPAPASAAMGWLLDQLAVLDEEGRWGAAFAWRDTVRTRISAGEVSQAMDRLDWSLWWALLEELDRLQPLEAASP